ncbi:MAG: PspC protein [Nonomuraea muscovyensis]|nr:PspC protein [Nonomuraea muscovyensis]
MQEAAGGGHDGSMTQAPPKEPGAPPRVLRRSSEGRFLLGICAGLGRHTGIDPVVFRVAFAVLLFGSGIGLFLYIAAFLLMKDPNGRPGYIEHWTQRDFDAEPVLARRPAVLGFGLAINLTTVWLDTGTLVVGVLLAVSLLAAHSSGVDLVALVRSMPERLNRRAAPPAAFPPPVTAPSEWVTTGLGTPAGDAVPAPDRRESAAEGPAPTRAHATEEVHPPARTGAGPTTDLDADPDVEPRVEPGAGPRVEPGGEPDKEHGANAASPAAGEAATARAEAAPGPAEEADRPLAYGELGGPERQRDGIGGSPENAVYGRPPFAPRGPFQPSGPQRRPGAHPATGVAHQGGFQPLDPRRRAGYAPYDPARYGRPPAPRPRRTSSFIGLITVLLAIVIGGIVVAVQAGSGTGVNPTIVGGAVLVTIGAGLLVAAWWGRGAGLVAAGTAVAVLVALVMTISGMPREVGNTVWVPLTAAAAESQTYDIGVGNGRLDLSEIELPPGGDLTVRASVRIGELAVIVPPDARVEVHASNRVGDIKLDQSLRGGVDVTWNQVLEPEVRPEGEPPTIVLHLRGGAGDMEVRRAA